MVEMGNRAMAALVLAAVSVLTGNAAELTLEKALPIESSELLQPSGLTMENGNLYMVSAREDGVIYRLDLKGDQAVMSTAVNIRPPSTASEGAEKHLVLRAVAADSAGDFYVLSEAACRILQVKKNGQAEWLGPSLLSAGVEKDLFSGENSGADGIARLGPGRFYVGAARQPRGLLRVDLSGEKPQILAFKLDQTSLTPTVGSKPELLDLTVDSRKNLYGLMANADAICRIKTGEVVAEGECWSYAATSGDAKYQFQGFKSGLGRGLAVDDHDFYVLLDNHGMARVSDSKDRRALLLIFKRPSS